MVGGDGGWQAAEFQRLMIVNKIKATDNTENFHLCAFFLLYSRLGELRHSDLLPKLLLTA